MKSEEAFVTCWGKHDGSGLPDCLTCPVRESCRWAYADSRKSRMSEHTWKARSTRKDDFSSEKSDFFSGKETFTRGEVIQLAAVLLQVRKSPALSRYLSTRFQLGSVSLSALARREGVTRQTLYKRIFSQICKVSGIRQKTTGNRKILMLSPLEFAVYKRQAAGEKPVDIMRSLSISAQEYARRDGNIKKTLFSKKTYTI